MNRRFLIIGSLGLVVIGLGIAAGVVYWKKSTAKTAQQAVVDRAEQLNAEHLATIHASNYEQLLFLSQSGAQNQLFIGSVDNSAAARVTATMPTYYSNFLPKQQIWLSASGITLSEHAWSNTTTLATLSQPVVATDSLGQQPALAIDPTAAVVSWVSRDDSGIENIHLLLLADQTDTVLYAGTAGETYSNLTWSPDGSELAFVVNNSKIVTVNQAGAQLYNPISLPFTQFSSLQWIERDHFGVVVSSLDTNPQPFQPRVLVLDRLGSVTEKHDVFKKIGVPKVMWSPDSANFAFRDPWNNHFLIYDRYDHLKSTVTFKAPGKLVPFGWVAGQSVTNTTPVASTPDTTVATAPVTTSTPAALFTVSATDWDKYNTTVRAVLEQFSVDFSTYRFATTDQGIQIAITTKAEQTQPELVAIQSIMQLFAVLPNVPAISFNLTTPNNVIQITNLTLQQAKDIVDQFTTVPLDQLFVVTPTKPIGKKTVKPENPNHNYVGDLVYSQFGDYNPSATLAAMNAKIDDTTYYTTTDYSLAYPQLWSPRVVDGSTTVWFTGETTFASATAWSGFAFTVKTYSLPDGVSLDQWLSVNRNDQTNESVTFTLHQPVNAQHIISATNYRDEYVLAAHNHIYALGIERDAGITDTDKAQLQAVAQSFTDTYAFQR